MSLLKVRNLSVDFYTSTKIIRAVRSISFDVAAGERVGLVGESGSGKTTSALALMRMIKLPGRIAGGTAYLGRSRSPQSQRPPSARCAVAARLLRAARRHERPESGAAHP